jgi:hypothetical protein
MPTSSAPAVCAADADVFGTLPLVATVAQPTPNSQIATVHSAATRLAPADLRTLRAEIGLLYMLSSISKSFE